MCLEDLSHLDLEDKSLNELLEECYSVAAVFTARVLYEEKIADKLFNFYNDESFIETLKGHFSRRFSESLGLAQTIKDKNKTILEVELNEAAHILKSIYYKVLDEEFPVDEFDAGSKEEKKSLAELAKFEKDFYSQFDVKIDPKKPLESFKEYFNSKTSKEVTKLLKSHTLSLYNAKALRRIPSQYSNVEEILSVEKKGSEVDYKNLGYKTLKDCMAEDHGSLSVANIMFICDRKLLITNLYALTNKEVLNQAYLTVQSDKQLKLVTKPMDFLRGCMDKIDPHYAMTNDMFKKYAQACIELVKYDVLINSSWSILRDPELSKFDDKSGTNMLTKFSDIKNCFFWGYIPSKNKKVERAFIRNKKLGVLKSFEDVLSSAHPTDKFNGSIFAQNSESPNYQSNTLLIKKFINYVGTEKINIEDIIKRRKKCAERLDHVVIYNMTKGIIGGSSQNKRKNNQGNTPYDILNSLFLQDINFVRQLLKVGSVEDKVYNQKNKEKGRHFNEKYLTRELSFKLLRSTSAALVELTNKGFIFDKRRMRADLFQVTEVIKDKLDFTEDDGVPLKLQELKNAFFELGISDTLSLSLFAESFSNTFQTYLERREAAEIKAYYKKIKREVGLSHLQEADIQRIKNRYHNLAVHVRNSAKSEKFRRIIQNANQDKNSLAGTKGAELLNDVKEYILLPKLEGKKPSPDKLASINKKFLEALKEINSADAFIVKFVKDIGGDLIKEQAEGMNGIWRWLVYDEKDFDWEILRTTDSGFKANRLYIEEILLPEVFGKKHTDAERKKLSERFKDLIKEAQGETSIE